MPTLTWWLLACNPPIVFDSSTPGETATDTTDSTDTAPDSAPDTAGDTAAPDADADGFTVADGDCDDADANRYPGAPEALNGLDEDCDGLADVGDAGAAFGVARTDGAGFTFGYALTEGTDELGNPRVIVGAPGGTGAVYVFDAASLGSGTTAGGAAFAVTGEESGAGFGANLTMAPLDGDIYPDLLVGSPQAFDGGGAIFVLDGARIGAGGSARASAVTHVVTGVSAPPAGFGSTSAVVGGYAWVGAPGGVADRGQIYAFDPNDLVRGAVSGAEDGQALTGAAADIGFGFSARAMDWDGDGVDELIVSAPGASVDGESGAGRAYVFAADTLDYALQTGDSTAAFAVVEGQNAGGYLGYLDAADLDGDGRDELLLGSYIGPELADRRVVAVDTGGIGLVGASDVRLTVSGLAVADSSAAGFGAGDIDGDGKADLLVGDFGSSPGRTLVFGTAAGLASGTLEPADATAAWAGLGYEDAFGAAVLGLDATGDGADDLLVGAPLYSDGVLLCVPSYY